MYAGLQLGCQGACPLGLLGTHSAGLGAWRKEAPPSGAQGPGAWSVLPPAGIQAEWSLLYPLPTGSRVELEV